MALASDADLMTCMRCRAAGVVRVVVLVGYKPQRQELRCSACYAKPMSTVIEHGLLRGDGKLRRPLPSNIVAKMVDALAARVSPLPLPKKGHAQSPKQHGYTPRT